MGTNDERILRNKILIRPDEAADILRVSRATVYRLVERGNLSARKVGASVRILTESVRAMMEEKEP